MDFLPRPCYRFALEAQLVSNYIADLSNADFFKLVLYLTFFCVLCMFYGMPIHIIRDVALTIRSFYKRITDFVRYRQATRDMNVRYPDATAEEVTREDVCIICREDMRPWQQPNAPGAQPDNAGAARAAPAVADERLRPKKLPCGHILHFACLRSWLERQQNCPTCRRPVLVRGTVARTQEQNAANQHGRAQPQANQPQVPVPLRGNLQQPVVAQNVLNLGPLRIAFGARQIQGHPPQGNNDPHPPNQQGPLHFGGQIPRLANAFGVQRQAPGVPMRTFANFTPTNLQSQIYQIEQQLMREINGLCVQQNQLQLVRALQGELARLRIAQANPDPVLNVAPSANQARHTDALPQMFHPGNAFSAIPQQQSFGTGHPSLPAGVTLPLVGLFCLCRDSVMKEAPIRMRQAIQVVQALSLSHEVAAVCHRLLPRIPQQRPIRRICCIHTRLRLPVRRAPRVNQEGHLTVPRQAMGLQARHRALEEVHRLKSRFLPRA